MPSSAHAAKVSSCCVEREIREEGGGREWGDFRLEKG